MLYDDWYKLWKQYGSLTRTNLFYDNLSKNINIVQLEDHNTVYEMVDTFR